MVMRQNASTGELVEDTAAPVVAPKKDVLSVRVWSPFRVYFIGEAASVSGVNATGPFDILPRHRNFISLLNACELVIQPPEGELKIRISGGIMRVHKDTVTVFLEV